MTALSESLLLTLIHDVFSLLILTYLHFSWVRKPVLDIVTMNYIAAQSNIPKWSLNNSTGDVNQMSGLADDYLNSGDRVGSEERWDFGQLGVDGHWTGQTLTTAYHLISSLQIKFLFDLVVSLDTPFHLLPFSTDRIFNLLSHYPLASVQNSYSAWSLSFNWLVSLTVPLDQALL